MISTLAKNFHLILRDQRLNKQEVKLLSHWKLPEIPFFFCKKCQLPTFEIMAIEKERFEFPSYYAINEKDIVFFIRPYKTKNVLKSKMVNQNRETFYHLLSIFGSQKYNYAFNLSPASFLIEEELLVKQTLLGLEHIKATRLNKTVQFIISDAKEKELIKPEIPEDFKGPSFKDIVLNSFDKNLDAWFDYMKTVKNKGLSTNDFEISFPIFCIHLYDIIKDKPTFYKEICDLMQFFQTNLDLVKFYKSNFRDNKQFETMVRRLMEIIKISDPMGKKIFSKKFLNSLKPEFLK